MKLFEIQGTTTEFFTKREEIETWLNDNAIRNYIINDDLTVNVLGRVDLSNLKNMVRLPVQFGKVDGHFYIKNCAKLESLKGCPRTVGSSFSCYGCRSLITLKDGPQSVAANYSCGTCVKLTGFDGIASIIGGNLSFYGCTELKSFKDIHKHVKSVDRIDAENINIKSHMLGFLKIKHLRHLDIEDSKLQNIIEKYLPEGDILRCVDELSDAGYEEYAKL